MLEQRIADLEARMDAVASRGTINSTDASGPQLRAGCSTIADEKLDDVEVVEPGGFSSRPSTGEVFVIRLAGHNDSPVILCASNRAARPTDLSAGDATMYSEGGTRFWAQEGGDALVEASKFGSVKLYPSATGYVDLGEGIVTALALNSEMKAIANLIYSALQSVTAFWAALTTSTWAVDGPLIKALWVSTVTPIVTSLATQIATADGSEKGRG